METGEEVDVDGHGQLKWLIISFPINGGYLVVTKTCTERMYVISRREECDCPHVDSVFVVRWM